MIPTTSKMGPFGGLENCAVCRAITALWTDIPERAPGEQVACCKDCAKSKEPADVPTKKAWFDATKAWRDHGSKVIARSRVVSPPGSAITLTEYELTPDAKAALRVNHSEWPVCK